MILIDNNQLLIANIFNLIKYGDIEDTGLLRHMCLNTYRIYNHKFKQDYGDIIICHDSPHCWRAESFKHYKKNRKKAKQESPHDWNKIFDSMMIIKSEVESVFPWKNISVPRTEADDIIAIICKHSLPIEPVVIVSSDKDFQQLQKYSNVKQWSPNKKDFLVCDNSEEYLKEHIIRGDSSDGIPNILSEEDTFVKEDKRQKPMTKKKMTEIKENIETYKKTDRWNQNKTLIDFEEIPEEIEKEIMKEYNKPCNKETNKIFPYLMENKLVELLETAEELY